MKSIFSKICLLACLTSPIVHAAPALFEDFSDTLSMQKFSNPERNILVENQELVLASRASSYLVSIPRSTNLSLLNSENANFISADLKVSTLSLGNANTQAAMIRIGGGFYDIADGNNIWVTLNLGDRGNGLEAWYEIFDDTYDTNGSYISSELAEQGSITTEGLSLDTAYSASITYDGNNGFTFDFNDEAPVITSGPTKVSESNFRKGASARVRFGQNNGSPSNYINESAGTLDDGTTAVISGTVDNVNTDIDGVSDDFTSSALSNWSVSTKEQSMLITDNDELEMIIDQDSSNRSTQRLNINQKGLKYIGAKVSLSSDSEPGENARIRARVVNYVGNDTYDITSGDIPNGWEGSIYTQIALDRIADGSFRLSAYIERADDAAYNSSTQVVFQVLTPSIPPAYDVSYDLAIEQIDSVINFIVDGNISYSYDLSTSDVLSSNLYPPTDITSAELNARIQNGSGKVVALFDDVTTDIMPTSISLNGINSDDEQVALPEEVIVNVGEVVMLIAESANPDDIIRYVWEQISGTDVEIASATARVPNVAAKIVGTENTLSFTIPDGSDTEDLAFKLTTVNTSGFEAEELFALTVDNSQASTLSSTATEPEPASSGGGGSFNIFFIFMLLLTFTAKLRMRSKI